MMQKFKAMSVFCAVVESGSFSRASNSLGISTSAVSRYIYKLEENLGVKLLNRSTRHLDVTYVGKEYYQTSVDILNRVQHAEKAIKEQGSTSKGLLRVGLSHGFGEAKATKILFAFKDKHPNLTLEIVYGDQTDDLTHEGLDLSIRVTGMVNESLIARKLSRINLICCAAPMYLERVGFPKSPSDLKNHQCLTYAYANFGTSWTFYKAGEPSTILVNGGLKANNGQVLKSAACNGMGIILLPTFHIESELNSGELIPVLSDYELEKFSAYVVYQASSRRIEKIKTLVDYLMREFKNN